MRLQQILHLDDGEFVEARAAEEAKPARTQQLFKAAYPGVSGDALAWMRTQDTTPAGLGMRRPVAPEPIVQTDWTARLDKDFDAVHSALTRWTQQTRQAVRDLNIAAYNEYRAYDVLRGMCGGLANDVRAWRREVADWNTMAPQLAPFADAVKAGGSL